MRPFFSYYGAKYTGAKHYGPPRHETVIEPFAGSACYSTYWNVKRAKLYDVSLDICDLWDFLINCSARDIEAIPDSFSCDEELLALQRGPRLLCAFWVSKGRAEPSTTLSPWYRQYRNSRNCRVWGPSVKRRILAQKPLIAAWSIDNLSYEQIPLQDAHWHVDPPYNNGPGRRYPYSLIDYNHLSDWVRRLPGEVDVCENEGATWLPFAPLYSVNTTRGKRSGAVSREAIFRRASNNGAL